LFNVLCSDIFFYISIRWTFFKVVAKKIFGWFAQSYLVNFKELLFFLPRLSRERPFIKNYLSTSVKRIFYFFESFFKPLNISASPRSSKGTSVLREKAAH